METTWHDNRRVKEIRCNPPAAGILGAEIRFFDSGDYPILNPETIATVAEHRELQPEFVLDTTATSN